VALISEQEGSQISTSTDSDGAFRLEHLDANRTYRVRVEALGFKVQDKSGVRVQNDPLRIVLVIDQLQQNVTVFEKVDEIEASAVLKTSVDPKQLLELPANDRDLTKFALLDPPARNTSGIWEATDGKQLDWPSIIKYSARPSICWTTARTTILFFQTAHNRRFLWPLSASLR
jgi:Carboxypeptidase regulatory-like domain